LNLGGYKVLQATGGEEAFRVLQRGDAVPDLALLDVIMPGMNGIELARRLQERYPTIKIVLMSGYGPREVSRVVGSENPYRIIWKPFKAQSLLQMIDNVMSESSGAIA
jgi:CheY-like chemotaxis protein